MDYQKIYDRLTAEVKTANDGKTAVTILPTEYAEQILEMMQKQGPKPVKEIILQTDDCILGYCPSCRMKVGSMWNTKACGFCGQAVTWDEENDG